MQATIVILAAGSARRMGRIKQLLPWGQTTLLGHAVQQALGCPEAETLVVLGDHKELLEQELNGLPVTIVYNPDYSDGLGSSIRAAVRQVAHRPDGASTHLLVMLADQPAVDTAYLSLLLDTAKATTEVVATDYGDRAGVPAVFPARSFPALQQLGGDAGAGKLLNAMEGGIRRLRPPFELFDIDTPEDYRRHERDS